MILMVKSDLLGMLAEIIDAVTRKIKKDPSSAKTLTDAINAAAAARSSAQSLPRVRKRGSDPLTVDGKSQFSAQH